MSDIEKDFNKLMALAERIQDESVFQKHPLYKKFKAKYQSQVPQGKVSTETLFRVLSSRGFYNEIIFWGKTGLEDHRLGNNYGRAYSLYMIVVSFHEMNDHENALEYGKKALENDFQPNDSFDTLCKRIVLEIMRDSSLLLQKKQDAVEYAKEIVKIDVIRCNKKEIEKFFVLQGYQNLIELQIANGDFKSAQKMINKSLSLFNINSKDPNKFLVSMAIESYAKILPWNQLLLEPHKITSSKRSKIDEDHQFFDCFTTDFDTIRSWYKKLHMYFFISKICWHKYEVHLHFGLQDNTFLWGNMAIKIVNDILYHIQLPDLSDTNMNAAFKVVRVGFNKGPCIKSSAELTVKNFMLEKISKTLLMADHDHKNRESLFLQLAKKLFLIQDDDKIDNKTVSWYIGESKMLNTPPLSLLAESLRVNDKLDLPKVMPFIQFCLKSLNGNVGDIKGANSDNNVDTKVQLMTLKNSLTVMNHFKTI